MAGSRKRHLQLFVMVVAATSLAAAAFATGMGILPSSMNAANDPAMIFESGTSMVYTTGSPLRIGPERSQAILGTAIPRPGEAIQGSVTVIHLGDAPDGDDLAASLRTEVTSPSSR